MACQPMQTDRVHDASEYFHDVVQFIYLLKRVKHHAAI